MSGRGVSIGGYNETGKIRRLGTFLTGSICGVGRKSFICCDGKCEGSQPCSDADRQSQSYISGKGRAT